VCERQEERKRRRGKKEGKEGKKKKDSGIFHKVEFTPSTWARIT